MKISHDISIYLKNITIQNEMKKTHMNLLGHMCFSNVAFVERIMQRHSFQNGYDTWFAKMVFLARQQEEDEERQEKESTLQASLSAINNIYENVVKYNVQNRNTQNFYIGNHILEKNHIQIKKIEHYIWVAEKATQAAIFAGRREKQNVEKDKIVENRQDYMEHYLVGVQKKHDYTVEKKIIEGEKLWERSKEDQSVFEKKLKENRIESRIDELRKLQEQNVKKQLVEEKKIWKEESVSHIQQVQKQQKEESVSHIQQVQRQQEEEPASRIQQVQKQQKEELASHIQQMKKQQKEESVGHIQQAQNLQKENKIHTQKTKKEVLQKQRVSTDGIEESRKQLENSIASRFVEVQKMQDKIMEKRMTQIKEIQARQQNAENQNVTGEKKQKSRIESYIGEIRKPQDQMLEKQIVEAEKRWEENSINHIQQVHRLQKEKETSDRTIKEKILQNQNVSTKRVEKSRQQIEHIESRFAEGQKQHEHVIEKRIAEIKKLQEQSANQHLAEKTKQETEIGSRIKTIWQQQEKNTEQRLFKKQKAWKENPVKYMQQVQRMQKEISDRKNMLPGQSTEKQSAGKEETQGKGIENHIVKIQQRVKSAEQQMQRLQEGNDTDYKTGKLLRKQNVVKYSEGKTEESKRQTEDIIKGGTEENIRQKNIFQRMILKELEGTKGNTGYPLISTVNVRKMPEIVQKGVLDLVKASKNFARFYAVTNEIRNSSYHEKEAAPYHLPVSEENYSAQELYTNGSKSIESRFAQSRNIQYLTGQNDFSETGSTDTLLNNSISFFGNDPFAVYNAYNEKQQWRRQQSEPMVKSGRVHKSVTNTVVSARQQKEIMEQVKELKNIVMQEKQEKLEEKKKVLQLQEILTEQSEKRKEQQTAQQKEKEQLQENAEIRDRMAMYEKAVENEDMLTRMRYGAWN